MSSHSADVLSIRQVQQVSGSQVVKDKLGQIVTSVMPGRTRELYRQPTVNPGSFAEKAIMFHLRRRAIREDRHQFLARLHKDFWASENGAVFSHNCDHRFEDLFLGKQQDDFTALQDTWKKVQCHDIVEIGANSGLLLQHMTKHLPGVRRSVGIDINQQQVDANNASRRFDPRIEFLCTDGQQWVMENGSPSTLFVTNGGVLEYFPREKLDELLSHISTNCGRSVFYCSEPVADDHDFGTNKDSIPFGEECSFSHNYRDLFESNGFTVLHQRAVQYESWKMQATIAITNDRSHSV